MLTVEVKKQVNVKFLVKLTYLLKKIYTIVESMGPFIMYTIPCMIYDLRDWKWEVIADDSFFGGPCTSKTYVYVGKVGERIQKNGRLTIRTFAECTGIVKNNVRKISIESVKIRQMFIETHKE